MSNIFEEIERARLLMAGLDHDTKKRYDDTRRFIARQSVYNILYRTIIHLLPAGHPKVKFRLLMDSGSFTDSKSITVGVPRYVWGMPHEMVFSVLKALTGHETEHVRSSDFEIFKKFQEQVAEDFQKRVYQLHPGKILPVNTYQCGIKLGAHLLNSTEDGRIEKRLVTRMRGYLKHVQFMNALIWQNQPVNGQNPLMEFLFAVTTMCVTGLKSHKWGDVYGGTEMDRKLDEIRPLIIRAINEPTPQGCADVTFEIYERIVPLVVELLMQDTGAMSALPDTPNFSTQGGGKKSKQDSVSYVGEVSTHFVPEQPQGVSDADDQNSPQSVGKPQSVKGNPIPNPNGENQKDQSGKSSKPDDASQDGQAGEAEDSDQNDSNDLTDESEQWAKEEEKLVNEFLQNAQNDLLDDLENDMQQIKNEELRIQREKARKKAESGDLTKRELQDALKGRGFFEFELTHADIQPSPVPDHILHPGKKLSRRLKQILLDKQGYTARNRRRGRLDSNALWRVGVKEYDVFVKRGNPQDSTYVVEVLVDNSGSMTEYVKDGKTKKDYAREACAILEEGLRGLVPFRIVLFDDDFVPSGFPPDLVRHEVISDFGDTESVNRSWSAEWRYGSCNADSISIRIATKELLKRPESKKILFVLSDGLPSSYIDEKDAITSVKNAVRDARKQGVIVIAICFGSKEHLEKTRTSYREMYQHGIIMTEPENIPAHLVKVLEQEIK
jgi:nitric oxide reductase activation protein